MMIINLLLSAKYYGEAKDDSFFWIIDKEPLEKIDDFTGRCVKFRQLIWRIKTHIHDLAFAIISNKIFDGISLFVIVLNSAQLSIQDPTQSTPTEMQNTLDTVFLVFYTTEMCLKITGLGFFFNTGAYLRDPWNVLDFVIVCTGLLQEMLQGGSVNLSGMRSFRVLRPLKTISGIEGLRIIVSALLKSAKLLMETFIVLFFFYLIFSIAGLQMFIGILKKQCVNIESGKTLPITHQFYQCGGYGDCPDGYFCGRTNSNPNFEQTSFDNIFYSFIIVYQSVTLEGWTYDMKYTQYAYSNYAWFFFCPLVFIVSFFLLQLTQAVIKSKFTEEHELQKKNKGQSKKKKKKKSLNEEFENLDKEKKEEYLKMQLGYQNNIMTKWKQILFLKNQMRIMVRQFQQKKREEETIRRNKKIDIQMKRLKFLNGLGLNIQEQINYANLLGFDPVKNEHIFDQDSNRQLLEQNSDKQINNDILKQEEKITEDGDDHQKDKYNFKQKNIYFNRLNQLNANLTSPYFKKQNQSKFPNQTETTLKMQGMETFKKRHDFDEKFFEYFIKQDLNDIEKMFSQKELEFMVQNFDGGSEFLKNLELEEDFAYFNIRKGGMEAGQLQQTRMRNQFYQQNIYDQEIQSERFEDEDEEEEDNQILQQTPITNTTQMNQGGVMRMRSRVTQMQITNEEISTSGDIIRRDNNNNQDNNTVIDQAQLQSQLQILNQNQQLQQENLLLPSLQINNNDTFNINQQKQQQQPLILQDQLKDKQLKLSPIAETEQQKINRLLKKDSSVKNDKSKKRKSRVVPQNTLESQKSPNKDGPPKQQQTFDIESRIRKKFAGTNTITQRDFIPIEESYLNNKYLVQEDVGFNKKIHLRMEKFDFQKPAEDIFELRNQRENKEIEEEQKKESIDYLGNIKIRPYQRKCQFDAQHLILSDDQNDMLLSQQYELYDVENQLQKQYNRAFLSNLYVTGTLSIVIKNNKDQERVRVRKLQNLGAQQEEKENPILLGVVKSFLTFANLSIRFGSSSSNLNRSGTDVNHTSTINMQSMFGDDVNSMGAGQSSMKQSQLRGQTPLQSFIQRKKTVMSGGMLSQKNQKSTIQQGLKSQANHTQLQVNNNNVTYNDLVSASKRKEKNIMKKANKNTEFRERLILSKVNKDATRSTTFRFIVIQYRNAIRAVKRTKGEQFVRKSLIGVTEEDIADSSDEDNEDEKRKRMEVDEDDDMEENMDDFFLDFFDNTIEVKRAKKSALQRKISKVQWSGQDVLQEYDPEEAGRTITKIGDIRVWPKGLHRLWKILQVNIKNFVMGTFMDNFMTLCVAMNTITLAIDRYGIDPATNNFLTSSNTVFTYIFISEMAMKLIGLGPIRYLKDKMNYLDGTVVMLSMVELFLSSGGGAISAFRSIRMFRTFRVLRITRLLRAMKDMTSIINALMNSMGSLMYLFMLMFLFIFIFSLLGMQIYGGKMDYAHNTDGIPGVPRQNYDSFYWAFQTAFQLITQENWQIVLYDTLRSPYVNQGLTMIYHIAWMTLGNTTLLNLLMAIMLDAFDDHKEEETLNEEDARKKHLEMLKLKEGEEIILYFQEKKSQDSLSHPGGKGHEKAHSKKKKKSKKKDENILDESFELDEDFNINIIKKKKDEFEGNYCELSMYLFSKKNPFRRFLYWLINHSFFEAVIQILIMSSSIKLVADGYAKSLPPDSTFVIVSDKLDYFFTAAFAMESLLKSLSLGFIMDRGSYLRESWSKLDFFIVTTSLIDASFSSINIPVIKILRLLRTLRPLRVISHNSEMKTIIAALVHSITGIFYVAILLLVVYLMFAILGVNFIGGRLFQCSVDPYDHYDKESCLQAQGKWFTWYFNYDNVLNAMISLFDIATTENWPDQRNVCSDISGIDTGPIRNNMPVYAYYFNAFILIGNFCFLNLFIGVIFIKFGEAQKDEQESTLLDDDQFKWLDMLKMIIKAKPDLETTNVPENRHRKLIHEFVTGLNDRQKPGENIPINKFEVFIMACIVLNMFQMCMTFDGSSDKYNQILDYVNYGFTAVFVVEMSLKFVAFGLTYFQNSWNIFDFIIVMSSIADISMNFLNARTMSFLKVGPQLARILRVLRVSRLFRLIKKYKGLNSLLQTIVFSLPAIMNVFALFMLVYFIFAILGSFLFSDVTQGMIIDDLTNFSNFGKSMLTLIRCSTGEDWNYIMIDCGWTTADGCIPGVTCGSSFATLFFVAFMTLQTFIMMNLYVLVIIQQFEKYYLSKGNILEMFKEDLSKFKEMWTFFTREHNCIKMKDKNIIGFFQSMDPPLGMKGQKEDEVMRNIIMMDIEPDQDGFYYFNELLFKTMKHQYCKKAIKNKLLAIQEYKAYQSIAMIKENLIKKQREDLRKQVMSANPFVLKMFKHISFKLWINRFQEYREVREGGRDGGDISEPEIQAYGGPSMVGGIGGIGGGGVMGDADNENEDYVYETEKDESCSEDEDEEERKRQFSGSHDSYKDDDEDDSEEKVDDDEEEEGDEDEDDDEGGEEEDNMQSEILADDSVERKHEVKLINKQINNANPGLMNHPTVLLTHKISQLDSQRNNNNNTQHGQSQIENHYHQHNSNQNLHLPGPISSINDNQTSNNNPIQNNMLINNNESDLISTNNKQKSNFKKANKLHNKNLNSLQQENSKDQTKHQKQITPEKDQQHQIKEEQMGDLKPNKVHRLPSNRRLSVLIPPNLKKSQSSRHLVKQVITVRNEQRDVVKEGMEKREEIRREKEMEGERERKEIREIREKVRKIEEWTRERDGKKNKRGNGLGVGRRMSLQADGLRETVIGGGRKKMKEEGEFDLEEEKKQI